MENSISLIIIKTRTYSIIKISFDTRMSSEESENKVCF
jgi:hypothetical protein